MSPNDLVSTLAYELGFNLVGFVSFDKLSQETCRLESWLNSGFQGSMSYMERNLEKRFDVRNIFPSARSIISLGLNYYNKIDEENLIFDCEGKVSKYAWGGDYHEVMWEKCRLLIEKIKLVYSDFEAYYNVDSGPVMDKAWAVRGGLGWMGKHSNIINRNIGSWFFIATIICNYELSSSPLENNHCGICTACIDACPTSAIVNDYIIDSRKCISYLTIENKEEIPDEFKGKFEKYAFGCDICQIVCPWNIKKEVITIEQAFKPDNLNIKINLNELKLIDNKGFKIRFVNSPILRAKLKGVIRNLEFIYKNE